MSLSKTVGTMGKCGPPRNQTKNIYIVRKILMRAIQKNVKFIEFETLCQMLWAFMSTFTMATHQIWSCHVTLATSFENISFSFNSIFTSGKVTKFGGNWLKNKTLQAKNKTRSGRHPPPLVLIGLKLADDYNTWGTQLLLRSNFRKSFSQHFDWIFVTFCKWL